MLEILKSDFFIGTMVGLLISFVGGWALARFTIAITTANARRS